MARSMWPARALISARSSVLLTNQPPNLLTLPLLSCRTVQTADVLRIPICHAYRPNPKRLAFFFAFFGPFFWRNRLFALFRPLDCDFILCPLLTLNFVLFTSSEQSDSLNRVTFSLIFEKIEWTCSCQEHFLAFLDKLSAFFGVFMRKAKSIFQGKNEPVWVRPTCIAHGWSSSRGKTVYPFQSVCHKKSKFHSVVNHKVQRTTAVSDCIVVVETLLWWRHCCRLVLGPSQWRTWSASAKLAVIFPGISFVTGLVLCNHLHFFLSRVLLLGFGKLLSIKKKCHFRFVVMCVGFTTNCQNKSWSKSLPPDIHPLLFYTSRPTH